MENLDFIKKILTSNSQYWVAARKEYAYDRGRFKPLEDSVWVICIPHTISLNQKPNEILLQDAEGLSNCEVHNIAISEPFAPFQHGIYLNKFYRGFPLEGIINIKEFMVRALRLASNDIFLYEEIIKEMSAPQAELTTSKN